jgi:hypothetical protein
MAVSVRSRAIASNVNYVYRPVKAGYVILGLAVTVPWSGDGAGPDRSCWRKTCAKWERMGDL